MGHNYRYLLNIAQAFWRRSFPWHGNGEELNTHPLRNLVCPNSDSSPLCLPEPLNFPLSSPDTKGLYFQAFGGRRRCLSKSVAPQLAHGYRRFLPTKDHVFILDYAGTLFFLKNALVSSTLGQIQWKRACRYVVLCRGAKDVSNRTWAAETPSFLRELRTTPVLSWHPQDSALLYQEPETKSAFPSPTPKYLIALPPDAAAPASSHCKVLDPGHLLLVPLLSFPTVCLRPEV